MYDDEALILIFFNLASVGLFLLPFWCALFYQVSTDSAFIHRFYFALISALLVYGVVIVILAVTVLVYFNLYTVAPTLDGENHSSLMQSFRVFVLDLTSTCDSLSVALLIFTVTSIVLPGFVLKYLHKISNVRTPVK